MGSSNEPLDRMVRLRVVMGKLRAGIAGSNWRAPAWEAGDGPTSHCQKVPLLAQ